MSDTETSSALRSDGKAEVDDFKLILVAQHDVFRLKITMTKSTRMNVMKALKKLLEEEAAFSFGESTTISNEVEELSTANSLHSQVAHWLIRFALSDESAIFFKVKIAHHVSVVEILGCVPFLAQVLEDAICDSWV